MILSDRSIREELAAGRIVIDPLDESCIQPSSVDVRLDGLFRVFRNHTAGVIDVKDDLTGLTELVEIADDGVFMLHPGEFVLGSTRERVALPDDVVGRIEGKSSLARLGLLIHSSLPADEPLLVLDGDGVVRRTIGDLVKEPRPCRIVAFDPVTLRVDYHDVTGVYEGLPDRLYEVRLASGRSVRVTAGHNLFTLDRAGEVRRVRTSELAAGTMVAVARAVPAPPAPVDVIDVLGLVPESERRRLTVQGPTVQRAFVQRRAEIAHLLRESGYQAVGYYVGRGRLPWPVAVSVPGLLDGLGPEDRIGRRGERHTLPVRLVVDQELAWALGMYVAEGSRRAAQITISNTDQSRLDRLQRLFTRLGLPLYRSPGAITCCSTLLSDVMSWLGTGGRAPTKRVPPTAFGWSDPVLRSLLDGVVDGDGSNSGGRTSVWTTSSGLVDDLLLLFARLGQRAGCCVRHRRTRPIWQVYAPDREHKLLTSVPLADEVTGDVAWDRVIEVVDTGRVEPVYDLEVRPGGRKIENFLAGGGGVFVSNTAGFIDAGFEGHITLELSNVATLPITLYPGMKIGQISFMEMTTAADQPYGKGARGSKYQGQRGPTPSRYFENFRE